VELDSDIHLIWLSDVIDEIASEIESFVGEIVPSTSRTPGPRSTRNS
jgi:hypothetical protein